MDPQLSASSFARFFAWAPIVIGIIIYAMFYIAKRGELAEGPVPIGQTYACAACGRRGRREHMVAREHAGAVAWYCSRCAYI